MEVLALSVHKQGRCSLLRLRRSEDLMRQHFWVWFFSALAMGTVLLMGGCVVYLIAQRAAPREEIGCPSDLHKQALVVLPVPLDQARVCWPLDGQFICPPWPKGHYAEIIIRSDK